PPALPPFPTRRSSDLIHLHALAVAEVARTAVQELVDAIVCPHCHHIIIPSAEPVTMECITARTARGHRVGRQRPFARVVSGNDRDRKSTRLNSSHRTI